MSDRIVDSQEEVVYGANKLWLLGVVVIAMGLSVAPFVWKSWDLTAVIPFIFLILGFFIFWIERAYAFRSAFVIEHRLRELFNFSPEGIILLDRRKCVYWVNPAAEQVLTRERSEIVGLHIKNFFPGADFNEIAKRLLSANPRATATSMTQLQSVDKEKANFLVQVGMIVRGPVNKPIFTLVVRDIREKERVAIDAEFLKLMGSISTSFAKQLVAPSHYIFNALIFLQARVELLMRFNEKMTQWIFGLSNVVVPSELRKDEAAYQEFVSDVPPALRDAIQTAGTTNELVKTAISFLDRSEDKVQPLDLNKLMEDILIVSRGCWSECATLDLELDQAVPLVHCYPDIIKFVLFGLVFHSASSIARSRSNSMEKLGRIVVGTKLADKKVEISVGESGGGEWSDYFRESLFFEAGTGSDDENELAVVKNLIITKQKGVITFEKQVGKLSIIRIQIPLKL